MMVEMMKFDAAWLACTLILMVDHVAGMGAGTGVGAAGVGAGAGAGVGAEEGAGAEDGWVREAETLPLAFAQTREDPLVECAVLCLVSGSLVEGRTPVETARMAGVDLSSAAVRSLEFNPVDMSTGSDIPRRLCTYCRRQSAFRQVANGLRVMMIASGGDTVAFLAGVLGETAPGSRIVAVDSNRFQLEHTFHKLRLLACPRRTRLAVLGHGPVPATVRAAFDAQSAWMRDADGRYERLFAEWRRRAANHTTAVYKTTTDGPDERSSLLRFAKRVASGRLSLQNPLLPSSVFEEWKKLWCSVVRPDTLVRLFGNAAANPDRAMGPFCRFFAFISLMNLERVGSARSADTSQNDKRDTLEQPDHEETCELCGAWTSDMMFGEFGRREWYDWHGLPAGAGRGEVQVEGREGDIRAELRDCAPNQYHMVQLSNVLDWMSEQEAVGALRLAHRALAPGGYVVVRKLNSRHKLESMLSDSGFEQPARLSDRSGLYLFVLFARKPVAASSVVADPSLSAPPSATSTTAVEAAAGGQTAAASPSFAATHRARTLVVGGGDGGGAGDNGACGVGRALAEWVVADERTGPLASPFFPALLQGDLVTVADFQESQCAFRHAVAQFAPAMMLLAARFPTWEQRVALVANVAEEHGHNGERRFVRERAHTATFDALLSAIQANCSSSFHGPVPAAHAFAAALHGLATHGHVDEAVGAFAAIELAFANVSSTIARAAKTRGWDVAHHYSEHAHLDVDHADQLLALLDDAWGDPERAEHALRGLRVGALIFRQLYDAFLVPQTQRAPPLQQQHHPPCNGHTATP